MEIELHQRGGVLGMDRRCLVKDGRIEVVDKGRSRGSRELDSKQRARIHALAASAAAAAPMKAGDPPVSDEMETELAIHAEDGTHRLNLRSGDGAPREVWDLIGEVSRAVDG